jgi:GNAT superfamily N-acetyltransferase
MLTTTYLEMRSPEELHSKRSRDLRFSVKEVVPPQWELNRFLYTNVGGQWLWLDKLTWTELQWRDYVTSPGLRTFLAEHDGRPAGYYELRNDEDSGVEIAYFGLLPAFIGKGFGGPLLTHAILQAWSTKPARIWVHTCDRDHTSALPNYLARGMKIYEVQHSEPL